MKTQKTNNNNLQFSISFIIYTKDSNQQFLFENQFIQYVFQKSVISIHAHRVRILPRTMLSNIYKCTFYFEPAFVRIEDDSCC